MWLGVNGSLDEGFCVQYESCSFDPLMNDLILEKSQSKFLVFENFVPLTIDLDQILSMPKLINLRT